MSPYTYTPSYRPSADLAPVWETSLSAFRRLIPGTHQNPALRHTTRTNSSTGSWRQYVFDVNAPSDIDAISETIALTFRDLSKFGPKAIDLTNLDPSLVHGEHLASVLRATSRWQEQVPGWRQALWVAACALQK